MQILFLSTPLTVVLCFAGWFVFQVCAALIALRIPDRLLSPDRFPYRMFKWEKGGRFYLHLGVHRWKRLLPDGAAVTKGGYRKKSLNDYSQGNLERFLIESCRAELTHLLAIVPFWVFGLIAPPSILVFMLIYALAVNLPCMMAQRYNRPRIIYMKAMLAKRERKNMRVTNE